WVPVVVRCKDLAAASLGAPLRELLAAQLVRDGEVTVGQVQPLAQELADRVRRGDALLLVDGLDEIDADSRVRLAATIERTVDLHPDTTVVVTSRHTGLVEALDVLGGALDHYEIAVLRPEHQQQFLEEWSALSTRRGVDDDPDDLRRVLIGTRELARLGEFIQPLTLIAEVHLRDGSIPPNRAKLYRKAVGELLRSRGGQRHIDEVWPEMTHLAYRMHESGAVVWEMDDAEAAVDQFLDLAREHGLDRRLRRPLPASGAEWLTDAVQLAILNQSGRPDVHDELHDDYDDDEYDDDDVDFGDAGGAGGGSEPALAARLEFCHLAFQEFCAAHALLSPHRVIARD
ncbi:MAG: NACHT domain-containing protein, partial [Microthrixaceae bacterium]